jgi:hypothetical protein
MGPNGTVNNFASGIISYQGFRGFQCIYGTTGNTINNQGTINYSGDNFALALAPSFTFNNSGTFNIISGGGIPVGGGTLNNLACGKILMANTDYGLDNSTMGSITTNAGLFVTNGVHNTNGTFTNMGVLKYNKVTGTVTNTGNGAVHVRNNTYPIFNYGGTFNGTINGIFTNATATIPAGTFTAPHTFVPLATLPRGIQTLYAKITLSGGACTYIVPFTYNNIASPTNDLSNVVKLHQNHPNPFSQETIIAFDLSETNKAVLTVFDRSGRQVFIADKTFNIGYNEVILSKSVFPTAGTYFYRLTTDKYAVVKKLQFYAE